MSMSVWGNNKILEPKCKKEYTEENDQHIKSMMKIEHGLPVSNAVYISDN